MICDNIFLICFWTTLSPSKRLFSSDFYDKVITSTWLISVCLGGKFRLISFKEPCQDRYQLLTSSSRLSLHQSKIFLIFIIKLHCQKDIIDLLNFCYVVYQLQYFFIINVKIYRFYLLTSKGFLLLLIYENTNSYKIRFEQKLVFQMNLKRTNPDESFFIQIAVYQNFIK